MRLLDGSGMSGDVHVPLCVQQVWHVQWGIVPPREELASCSLDSTVAGNQDRGAYRQSCLWGSCELAGRNSDERKSGSESDAPRVEPATVRRRPYGRVES